MIRAALALVLGALILLGSCGAAGAGGATPREAVVGFLTAVEAGDWRGAAAFLDLSGIPAGRRDVEGADLARHLAVVLERSLPLDTGQLSDDPAGDRNDGLAANLERLGVVRSRTGAVEILLRRADGTDGGWKIAPRTLAALPALYADLGPGWIESMLPRPLVDIRFLEIALWQWLALLFLVLVAWGASWAAVVGLRRVARRVVARSVTRIDDHLVATLMGPAWAALGLIIFAVGVVGLGLTPPVERVLTTVVRAGVVLILSWAMLRIVDVFASSVMERLVARRLPAAVAMVPVGSKAAKGVVLVFAGLATLQNVGVNVTGVLAGLGIGGLAIALAAQRTVENLFGGVTVIVDQPVRVGDFCRFGERVGTVEEVGLRSTRVRTLDRSVVSIPNGEFASMQLENFSRRDRMWLHVMLGLRYETTPDQLRAVLERVHRLLRAHSRVDPEPARIRFVGFGAYSLDCEIFAYVLTADFGEFLAIREEILLQVMDAVAASGTAFAFPSQTLYVGPDPGLDPAKSRAAEAGGRAGWTPRPAAPDDGTPGARA